MGGRPPMSREHTKVVLANRPGPFFRQKRIVGQHDGPPGGASGAHGTHTFAARSGHHLPPRPLSSGHNVFEELGPGFTLLAFDGDGDTVDAFERAAASEGLPLKIVRDTYNGGREAYEAPLILVRPDQFVAWAGTRRPADVAGLVRKVMGRS